MTDSLTAREVEVLIFTAQGLTQPQIGGRLYLSTETVKTHARTARAKLGARTAAHAVAIGISRGLITLDPEHKEH